MTAICLDLNVLTSIDFSMIIQSPGHTECYTSHTAALLALQENMWLLVLPDALHSHARHDW